MFSSCDTVFSSVFMFSELKIFIEMRLECRCFDVFMGFSAVLVFNGCRSVAQTVAGVGEGR